MNTFWKCKTPNGNRPPVACLQPFNDTSLFFRSSDHLCFNCFMSHWLIFARNGKGTISSLVEAVPATYQRDLILITVPRVLAQVKKNK